MKEKNTEKIQVMFTPEQRKLVEKAAEELHLPVSSWIRTTVLISIKADKELQAMQEDLYDN